MFGTTLQTVVTIALFLWIVYLFQEIFLRLPPKIKLSFGGVEARRFAFWGRANRFNVDEFRVSHASGWDVGHEVTLICEGDVKDGDSEDYLHGSITLHSNLSAYQESNIFGWATLKDGRLSAHLTLHPDQVRDILNELRLAPNADLHMQGWHREAAIQIEYFSLSPPIAPASGSV